MKQLLQNLIRLQSLDFGEIQEKNADALKEELRGKIPAQILGHYDRLVARGKKGVAIVRDQVCTGCHMRLPIGVVTTLMHGNDIQLCDNCGRYLALAVQVEAKPAEPAAAPAEATKAKKPRKTKRAAVAVAG